MRTLLFRPLLLATALGASVCASAVPISLDSGGTSDVAPYGVVYSHETVSAQSGGFGSLTTLELYFVIFQPSDPGHSFGPTTEGKAAYSGAGGSLFMDVRLPLDTQTNAGYVGMWTATSGTGLYAGVGGGGTMTFRFGEYSFPGYLSSTTMEGEVQAVPEPATMLALGLGAAAVRRRRLG